MAIMILIYSGLFSDHVLDHVFSDHVLAGSCIFRSCTGWIMYFHIMYWLHHLFSDHVLAGSFIFRSCTGWIMYRLDNLFSDHVLAGSFFRSCTGWIIYFQIMYCINMILACMKRTTWPSDVSVSAAVHSSLSFFLSVCVCIFICVFIYLFCMFRSAWLGAKHYLLTCMFRCLLFICSFSCIFVFFIDWLI